MVFCCLVGWEDLIEDVFWGTGDCFLGGAVGWMTSLVGVEVVVEGRLTVLEDGFDDCCLGGIVGWMTSLIGVVVVDIVEV